MEAFLLGKIFGAADQVRTDDLLHGKQTLYQLSYNRVFVLLIIRSEGGSVNGMSGVLERKKAPGGAFCCFKLRVTMGLITHDFFTNHIRHNPVIREVGLKRIGVFRRRSNDDSRCESCHGRLGPTLSQELIAESDFFFSFDDDFMSFEIKNSRDESTISQAREVRVRTFFPDHGSGSV